RMALYKRDESFEFTLRDRAAGGVVRIGDADKERFLPKPRREVLRIQTPPIVESKVDRLHVRADGAGSLEVCCVVRRADECVCVRAEQRRGDDEERGCRPCGYKNVIR